MAIHSVQNISKDDKRNIAMASGGSVIWGGKELYNTFNNIKMQKHGFKIFMRAAYNKDTFDYIKQSREKDLENARALGIEDKIKEVHRESDLKWSQDIKAHKMRYKNEIKDIQKNAPFKITIKMLGGAAIGLLLSMLITHLKNYKYK